MNPTVVSFAVFFVCFIQWANSRPIVEPAIGQQFDQSPSGPQEFEPNQRAEADEFMRNNGVTQEEVEEYQHITGFNPPADAESGDERMFGLYHKIKYWNHIMYDRFRQWLAVRRQTTTTYRPVVVINQYDRPTYGNTLPHRY